MKQKEIKELRKLINKARKIDEEFMNSTLPIRLEFSYDINTGKKDEWIKINNNLFRTDLKTLDLGQPTIIYTKYLGYDSWEEKLFNPMELNLKDAIKNGINLKSTRQRKSKWWEFWK